MGLMPGSPSHGPTSRVTVPLAPDAGFHSHSGVSNIGFGLPGAGGWPRAVVTWSVVSIEQGSSFAAVLDDWAVEVLAAAALDWPCWLVLGCWLDAHAAVTVARAATNSTIKRLGMTLHCFRWRD